MTELPPNVLSTGLAGMFILISRGVYFAAKGRWEESNQAFEKIAGFERINYAWALEKQGRVEEAKVQRDRAQKLWEQFEERFLHANIQVSLLMPRKVYVGEEFELRLDLVNVARSPGTIVRVEGLALPGSKVISLPSFCLLEESSIVMNQKEIGPFQVEPLKIRMTFEMEGFFDLNPCLFYCDDLGESRTSKAKPITVTAKHRTSENKLRGVAEPLQLKIQFKTEAAEKAFNYLVSAFEQDHIGLRLPMEKSGWRTLMEVVRSAQVTMHSMYGRCRRGGKATMELERLGLVESQFFLGERGRGGRILKIRVNHETESAKQ